MTRSARHGPMLTVGALLATLASGTTFSRSPWPAHVTLAGNFTVGCRLERVGRVLTDPPLLTAPLVVGLLGAARFGPRGDVPVRLVESVRLLELHASLADSLEDLPGFRPVEPAHRRGGYRPHLTLGPAVLGSAASRVALCSVALSLLDGDRATVVSSTPTPA